MEIAVSKYELGQLLDEAKAIITGGRQDSYGSPEDSFAKIAGYWSIYLKRRIEPREVAEMMTLFKIARMQGQKPHRDNYIDACGYLSIAADKMLSGSTIPQRMEAMVSMDDLSNIIMGEKRG